MKRFRILCTVLLVCMFAGLFQDSILSFMEGMDLGWNIATFTDENNLEENTFTSLDVVSTTPIEASKTNGKDGALLSIVPSQVSVMAFYPKGEMQKSSTEICIEIIGNILLFVNLGVYIWVFVVFVQIIISFCRSKVFEHKTISRINRIGFGFLAVGIMNTIWSTLNVYLARIAIQVPDFEFTYAKVINWDGIIIGVVILLMNEILRMATTMKEEQDLTI